MGGNKVSSKIWVTELRSLHVLAFVFGEAAMNAGFVFLDVLFHQDADCTTLPLAEGGNDSENKCIFINILFSIVEIYIETKLTSVFSFSCCAASAGSLFPPLPTDAHCESGSQICKR